MNKTDMAAEVAKTALALGYELDEHGVLLRVFWEEFGDWKLQTFQEAMRACRSELKAFPRPCQVRERRYSMKSVNRLFVDKPLTFRCLTCMDSGYVEVYDPVCYGPSRDNVLTIDKIRTRVVACNCEAGTKHQKPIEKEQKNRCRPLISFDQNQMKKVEAILPGEQVEELNDFMETWKPRNHNTEFDDWTR